MTKCAPSPGCQSRERHRGLRALPEPPASPTAAERETARCESSVGACAQLPNWRLQFSYGHGSGPISPSWSSDSSTAWRAARSRVSRGAKLIERSRGFVKPFEDSRCRRVQKVEVARPRVEDDVLVFAGPVVEEQRRGFGDVKGGGRRGIEGARPSLARPGGFLYFLHPGCLNCSSRR